MLHEQLALLSNLEAMSVSDYIDFDASYALVLAAHQKRSAKVAKVEAPRERTPEEQKERIKKQREYARQWYMKNMADPEFRKRRRRYAREWYARNYARSHA